MDTIGVSQTDFLSGEISMTFDLEKARDAAKFDDHMAITMFPLAIAEIERLRADSEQYERVIEARLDVIDQQAARIKELEADNQNLVTLNKSLMNNDWILRDNNRKYRKRAQKAELLNKELKSKIGPDARPKCDHAWQAAIEERGYQTCLKCGECRNIEDIPRTPAWQITEDRVTAIDQGLRFLEWSNAKTGNVETKKRIAILKTMLEEAGGQRPTTKANQ